MPQTCVSVTFGNLSSLTLQQEMIMAIQTGGSTLTFIPSLRGHSRSVASLGLITQPTLCECNRLGLVSLKFPFAHSGWHYRCSVTLATQQWMRVLTGARSLLRNARHRTMIMPVNPPRLRHIHISPSYQTVYRSFEIILESVLSIGLEFKFNVPCKPIAPKIFNLILIKLKKYLIAEGSSGSNGWARVKSERMHSREPLLRTIFSDSRHLQIECGKPTWNENTWTLTMPNGKSQS